jgi:3-hydroxyisobutyrate dehydrogenase-like beta-hydroxyacid dehydrogenase
MTEKPRIGFAGAGLMGHGMAKNIVEKGFPLAVMGHRNRAPIEDLLGRGATEAGDPAALVAGSDIIVLCLPGSPEVEAFVARALATDCTGRIFVDCSTSNPVSTRLLAATCAERGANFVDAPLARTPKEAWEGTLDVMLGASEAEAARIRPVLETFAGRIIRVGPVGAGHTMKLLNNFVSLGYAALYAEALAIGAKNGIDARTFHGVISGGRMDCGFFQTFMRYAVEGDREAHKFALRNAHKDMRYVLAVANESGIASFLAASVKNGFSLAEAAGHGEDYLPLLTDIVAKLNGIERGATGPSA